MLSWPFFARPAGMVQVERSPDISYHAIAATSSRRRRGQDHILTMALKVPGFGRFPDRGNSSSDSTRSRFATAVTAGR